jgi:hypothetical protein
MSINYRKNNYGAWVLSAMSGGYLEEQHYYGYTLGEALSAFREHLKETKA